MATLFGGAIGSAPIGSSPVASTRPGDAKNSVATASGVATLSGKSGRIAAAIGVASSSVITSSIKAAAVTSTGAGTATGRSGRNVSASGVASSNFVGRSLNNALLNATGNTGTNFKSGSKATTSGETTTLFIVGATALAEGNADSSVLAENAFLSTFTLNCSASSNVQTGLYSLTIALADGTSVAYGTTFILRPTYNTSFTRGQADSVLYSASINDVVGESVGQSSDQFEGSATALVTASVDAYSDTDVRATALIDADFVLSVYAASNCEGETGLVTTASSNGAASDNVISEFIYGANAISASIATSSVITKYIAASNFALSNNIQTNVITSYQVKAPVIAEASGSVLSYALSAYKLNAQALLLGASDTNVIGQSLVKRQAQSTSATTVAIISNSVFSSVASSSGSASVNINANAEFNSQFNETGQSSSVSSSEQLFNAIGSVSCASEAISETNSNIASVANTSSHTSSIFLSDNSAVVAFNSSGNSQAVFYSKSRQAATGTIQGNVTTNVASSKIAKVTASVNVSSSDTINTSYAFIGSGVSVNRSIVAAITSAVKASQSQSIGSGVVSGDGVEYVERIRLYSNTSIGIGYALTSVASSLPSSSVDISIADSLVGSGTAITETANGQSDTLIIF